MPDDQKPDQKPEVTEDTFRQWFEKYEKERGTVPASGGDQQPKGAPAQQPDIAAAVEAALSRREANTKRESRLSALEQSNTELSAQVKALTDQIKKAGRSVFSIFN